MTRDSPHLVVNDGVDEIEFYKRAFGAVEEYRYDDPDNKSIIYVKLIHFPLILL